MARPPPFAMADHKILSKAAVSFDLKCKEGQDKKKVLPLISASFNLLLTYHSSIIK